MVWWAKKHRRRKAKGERDEVRGKKRRRKKRRRKKEQKEREKPGREEKGEMVERSGKGWGNETECRVSVCETKRAAKTETARCATAELSSGGRTQGLPATSAEGPSRAGQGLPPLFFLPWISSNSSSKGSLGERPILVHARRERSFESGNLARGTGGGYSQTSAVVTASFLRTDRSSCDAILGNR